jgi:hypothetical protein
MRDSLSHMDHVQDHLAIEQLLYRYARGIDRCDEAALTSIWWPSARADYGNGEVDALEWSASVLPALSAMLRTQHFLGNILIELKGDAAAVETYCRAYHELESEDGRIEMEVGGRYLDRFERRDGEWRIAHRRYVLDWNRNTPSTAQWDNDFYSTLARRGMRKPDDPLYTGD